MYNTNVCRTCLSTNNRTHDLWNTQLQPTFENLTNIKLSTKDGRTRICYICYSQLQRCHRFLEMSQRADEMFKNVLDKGIELTPDAVKNPRNNFIVTPVECMSLPESVMDTLVTVKIEPTDIKEEVIDLDSCELVETVKVEGSPFSDDFIISVCKQDTLANIKMTDAELYTCNLCNKTYRTQKNLKRHLKVHNTKSMYQCKKCGQEYTRFDTLKHHMATHEEGYMTRDNCQTLTVNELKSQTKSHTCHICNKMFCGLSSLKKHVASHSTVKPFVCNICKKGFTHKSFLVVHIRTHTGERPFTCELCGKTFAQIGHAISHKRTHDKSKPFTCSQCEKSFAMKSTLNRHIRTHAGIKPYACEVCNMRFASCDTVKSHMRRHTGDKPYICSICSKGFTTSGNLQKHKKTHENTPDEDSQQGDLFVF